MILNDRQIIERAKAGMIEPFERGQVKHIEGLPAISFGASSYGYDMRIADEFKIIKNEHVNKQTLIDPKNFDPDIFHTVTGNKFIVIPPNDFVLGVSVERFKIPRDIMTVCIGKSTYARCGIIVNVTPFEPEWEGYVTIEISNTTPLPAKIYVNEGIAQVLFFEAEEECEVSYADRKGKYQGQAQEVTLARG